MPTILRAVVIVAVLCLSVAAAATSARVADGSVYLRSGALVDIGGYRLNIACFGTGAPTVVFDSGLEDWAPAWVTIQPIIARTTRTCTYDRAGNGFSDPGPLPRSADRIAYELHALLHKAQVPTPYILVGHSFGGINVRRYADRYLSDVAGIVLDDASAEDEAPLMTARERRNNDRDVRKAQAELRHCLYLAQRRFRGAKQKEVHACPGQFFRGLPDPKNFSRALNRTLIYQAQRPKQYAASADEFENFTIAGLEHILQERRQSFGDIPLRILVASHHRGSTPHEEKRWRRVHRDWLRLSSDAKYIAATKSGHYIQFDQPDLVIRAIQEEIQVVRKKR